MRSSFIDAVIALSKERPEVFILSGDAGLGVFDQFQRTDPHRFLNMGVAEQNMAGFAAGLAMAGFRVVLYNIIPFVLYRCYEQVRNDICYQRLPVVLTGIGSGVTYAPAGMTHYSVEDLGICRTLPNLTVLSPIDPVEARAAAAFALQATAPVYVRLPKRGEPTFHTHGDIDITLPQVLQVGAEVALLFHGSVAEEVIAAVEALGAEGACPLVIALPLLQPLAEDALVPLLAEMRHVVTVEEHFVGCGLGSLIARLATRHHVGWRLHTLGIADGFIHEIQDCRHLRQRHGISAAGIAATVRRLLGTRAAARRKAV
ncbi:MAG: transketolase [Candidatus Schekmanbacteria bacterium]|nr:transketolase [Candidatus Schekmanbacteria bacterium]